MPLSYKSINYIWHMVPYCRWPLHDSSWQNAYALYSNRNTSAGGSSCLPFRFQWEVEMYCISTSQILNILGLFWLPRLVNDCKLRYRPGHIFWLSTYVTYPYIWYGNIYICKDICNMTSHIPYAYEIYILINVCSLKCAQLGSNDD